MALSNEDAKKKGPFYQFASENVLTRLNDYESAVQKSYSASLSDQSISSSALEVPSVGWDQVAIDGVRLQEASDHGRKEFALKCLKAKAIKSEEDLTFNAMDLYTEYYLLTRLNHPNIIGIHGAMNEHLSDSYKSDGYFIVLDIMQTTLFDKLAEWRGGKSKQLRSKSCIVQRIRQAIMPVVEAMEYLHNHDVVLRDLKPENIGFDESGKVKLFDFGLARHISVVEDGDVAGSICYMAPEIMLEEGTYLASDVYSFAIILWEICTLQIPLIDFDDIEQVQRRVGEGNWRPNTSRIPSKTLRNLIKSCWNRNHKARPGFGEIEKELYRTCHKNEFGQLLDSNNNNNMIGGMGVGESGTGVKRSKSGSLPLTPAGNSSSSLLSRITTKF
eukprot:scaffold1223_cov119-Cylindrotheca_fusiformis.AAC.27